MIDVAPLRPTLEQINDEGITDELKLADALNGQRYQKQIDSMWNAFQRLEKVVKELEARPKVMSDKERIEDYKNRVADYLEMVFKMGQDGATYKETGQLLNLTIARVCQLRHHFANDPRFEVTWHPSRRGKLKVKGPDGMPRNVGVRVIKLKRHKWR